MPVRRHQRDKPRRVSIRFDHQHYSRGVNPAYLEFVKRQTVRINQPLGEQMGPRSG